MTGQLPGERTRAPKRRRAVPVWRRRTVLAALLAALLSGAAGGAYQLWQSGWLDRTGAQARARAVALSIEAGFRVDDILVLGRRETDKAALLDAVGLHRGAPILGFDPAAAKARVERLPWVRRARVERRLPDTILLHLEERKPLAVWQRDGKHRLIDRDGTVITGDGLRRFAALPLVVGAGAAEHAAALLDMLAGEPELHKRARAAVRVGARRWNLVMANGTDVRLPERAAETAWARLAEYEKSHAILSRDPVVLDLRQPDRLIVRLPVTAPDEPRRRGRET